MQHDFQAVATLAGGAAGRDEGLGQEQERVGVGSYGRRVTRDLSGESRLLGCLDRTAIRVEDHSPGQAQSGVDNRGVVAGDPQRVHHGAVSIGAPAHRPT